VTSSTGASREWDEGCCKRCRSRAQQAQHTQPWLDTAHAWHRKKARAQHWKALADVRCADAHTETYRDIEASTRAHARSQCAPTHPRTHKQANKHAHHTPRLSSAKEEMRTRKDSDRLAAFAHTSGDAAHSAHEMVKGDRVDKGGSSEHRIGCHGVRRDARAQPRGDGRGGPCYQPLAPTGSQPQPLGRINGGRISWFGFSWTGIQLFASEDLNQLVETAAPHPRRW
jgi:hypothetical protein